MPSGRLFSSDSLTTSTTGAVLTASGVPGTADLATVYVFNSAGGAAATFVINLLGNDGVFRPITTISWGASATITVPTAVPANGSGILIAIPGPINGLQVVLGGTVAGAVYIEINLSEDRAQ